MKGIYQIKNNINGKSYIGMTNNVNRRFYEHFAESSLRCKNTVLSKAIKKYGKQSFTYSIIENVDEDYQLPIRERFWIEAINPEYNMNEGGLGNCGITVSEVTRKKLREVGRSQWIAKSKEEQDKFIIRNLKGPKIGHHVSEETRTKLRNANLGKKQSPATIEKRIRSLKKIKRKTGLGCKSVVAKNKTGEVVGSFSSVKSASEFAGVGASAISSVLKGRERTAGGFLWSYMSVETNRDECNGVGVSLPHVQARGTLMGEEIVRAEGIVNLRGADKGMIQLAMRTGQYKYINADVVYQGEFKGFNKLTGQLDLTGEKTSDDVVGYFAHIETVNGFQKSMYMSKEDMEKYGKKYSKAYSKDFSPWQKEFDGMGIKTMLRRLIGKYGVMSIEMADGMAKDGDTAMETDYLENANQEIIEINPATGEITGPQQAESPIPGMSSAEVDQALMEQEQAEAPY